MTPVVAVPAIYRFPALQTIRLSNHARTAPSSWGWHRMEELDGAVTEAYLRIGYEGAQRHFIPDYRSFAQCMNMGSFSWLVLTRPAAGTQFDIYLEGDPEGCNFMTTGLHVPAGWGTDVLKHARDGVRGYKTCPHNPQRWLPVYLEGTAPA
ncbi:MAG: hypothetical protein Q7R88_00360 [bacterium]|nr:hypothetical protein [bacterium]